MPDAWTPMPRNKGQWRIKAVGGRGNRCLCRHELITIVTPLSRPGSAKTAASVCLYSVYRKQERSLFTAALEQMCRAPSSNGGPVVSYTQHPVGNRVSPSRCTSAFLQVRHGARDAAAARRFTRPPLRHINRLSSGVRREGGGDDSPARRPRADGRCTSPVALPPYPPP